MKKITRFVKDLGRGINSLCLCARFPFLYPRNRFTGLHWNNWKINDKLHELYNQSELALWVTVKPFEEKIGSEVISDITVLDYIKNKKYNTYKIQASDHTHYEIINKYNGKIMSILDINDFLEKTENCKTNDPSLLDTVLVWNAHEIKTNQWVKRNPKLPKYNYGLTLYYNSDNLKIKEDTKHVHKIKINKIAALKRNILKWIYENPLQYIFFWPTYNELDALEPGWRKVFGIQICKEIRHALYQNGGLKAIFNYRIMQIKEKFGCYDTETEVLTKNGWKFFKDVTYNDYIATLNHDTKELVYQQPTDIINEHYIGPMYHLQNSGVDLLVTPNHQLYVAKGSYFNGEKHNEKHIYPMELTMPDKYFLKDKRFEKTCKWNNGIVPDAYFKIPDYIYTNIMDKAGHIRTYIKEGPKIEIHAFLRFLGFYIAEGYTSNSSGCNITLSYNPKTEYELAKNLITDMGFNIHNRNKNKGLHSFNNVALGYWLREHCGHKAPNKKVPEFIKNLPSEYIEEFLYYLYLGNGHFAKTSCVYTTVSKQLSDDICELLLKCNSTFKVYQRPIRSSKKDNGQIIKGNYITYNINWLKLPDVEVDIKNIKSFIEQYEIYNDNVYCVTVPNHIIYVRRNGKGVWCGNSLRWYDAYSYQDVYDIISKYEDLSTKICICCGKPAEYMSRGWISYYCGECINKDNIERYKKLNDKNEEEDELF